MSSSAFRRTACATLVASLFCTLFSPTLFAAAPRAASSKLSDTPMRANDSFRGDMETARHKVYPALVNIAVVARFFEGGRAERTPAGGSGVIISPDGYVLTNFHVAGHTTRITCTSSDGVVYNANVVGNDPLSDISVLKLVLPAQHAPLPYAILGDSDKLQVGDFVLAMGNPLLLSSSMTLGIASNTKRVFTDFTGTELEDQTLETGERTGTFTRWIQHDALILPGNSGGPLVNLRGEVVGINELGGDGVGFAIPSNIARSVFDQIVKYGSVRRGWIGVSVLPVQKLGRTSGVLVSSVDPASPAEKAGIKPGQIITTLDGQKTNVMFFEQVPQFYQMIANLPQGHEAKFVLLDGKTTETKTATVQWMDPFLGDEEDFASAGLTVREITQAMAEDRFLPNHNGVLVTGVRPGYPFESAQPDLKPDDIITEIGSTHITDMASFRKALTDATKASSPGDKVAVAYRRNDEQLLTTITLSQQPNDTDNNELPQAWMGIKTQVVVPDLASALGNPDLKGFRVTEVYPYTLASKSGLMVGDIITKINDTQLDASRLQDADDLRQAVQALSIGDTANLSIIRSGAVKVLPVKLEASPDSAAEAKSLSQKELEFTVRDISDIDRFENHWSPSQKGILVTDATSGGYANIAGLRPDDLIVSIDGLPISKVGDIKPILDGALKSHPRSLEIFVRRDASTQFVFIEPDWSKITAFTEQ